jgi:Flp pilus assembly protein TadD
MTKKFCKQCGNALSKAGAKFCTTCGATVDNAGIGDVSDQETRGLPGEQIDQTAFATEVIPAITPPSYETEEMPRMIITARVEERATEVIEAIAPTTAAKSSKKQTEPAQEKQPSAQQPGGNPGGRKKLALAAAIGVVAGVALVAAAFLIVNSRRGSDAQVGTQTVDKVEPSTSPQPVAPQANQQASPQLSPPSGVDANNQAQSQIRPQPGSSIGEVKSPAVRNDVPASTPQRQAAAKPTPTPPQEKQAAGPSAAEHKAQGINYLSSGRYQEALQEFEYVKKLDPGDKDVYYLFGSTYLKMNQLERALEAYRQCTSGPYVSPSQFQVKNLEKKVGKVNAK